MEGSPVTIEETPVPSSEPAVQIAQPAEIVQPQLATQHVIAEPVPIPASVVEPVQDPTPAVADVQPVVEQPQPVVQEPVQPIPAPVVEQPVPVTIAAPTESVPVEAVPMEIIQPQVEVVPEPVKEPVVEPNIQSDSAVEDIPMANPVMPVETAPVLPEHPVEPISNPSEPVSIPSDPIVDSATTIPAQPVAPSVEPVAIPSQPVVEPTEPVVAAPVVPPQTIVDSSIPDTAKVVEPVVPQEAISQPAPPIPVSAPVAEVASAIPTENVPTSIPVVPAVPTAPGNVPFTLPESMTRSVSGEKILTPQQRELENQKLGKGVVFEPVLPVAPEPILRDGKRNRKSLNYRELSEPIVEEKVVEAPKSRKRRQSQPPQNTYTPSAPKRAKTKKSSSSKQPTTVDLKGKLAYCKKLINSIMRTAKKPDDIFFPFHAPIAEMYDPTSPFMIGYFTVITRPMDLTTVKNTLDRRVGGFASIDEFADDMRLIFQNAMTYNRPGTELYNQAQQCLDVFEGKFDQMVLRAIADKERELQETERLMQTQLEYQYEAEQEVLRKQQRPKLEKKKPAKRARRSLPAPQIQQDYIPQYGYSPQQSILPAQPKPVEVAPAPSSHASELATLQAQIASLTKMVQKQQEESTLIQVAKEAMAIAVHSQEHAAKQNELMLNQFQQSSSATKTLQEQFQQQQQLLHSQSQQSLMTQAPQPVQPQVIPQAQAPVQYAPPAPAPVEKPTSRRQPNYIDDDPSYEDFDFDYSTPVSRGGRKPPAKRSSPPARTKRTPAKRQPPKKRAPAKRKSTPRATPKSRANARKPRVTRTAPPPEPEPLSYEEKFALSELINDRLPPDNIAGVVDIIRSQVGSEDDDIELDIDVLDTKTLRALESYVLKTLNLKSLSSGVQAPATTATTPMVKPDDSSSSSSDSDDDKNPDVGSPMPLPQAAPNVPAPHTLIESTEASIPVPTQSQAPASDATPIPTTVTAAEDTEMQDAPSAQSVPATASSQPTTTQEPAQAPQNPEIITEPRPVAIEPTESQPASHSSISHIEGDIGLGPETSILPDPTETSVPTNDANQVHLDTLTNDSSAMPVADTPVGWSFDGATEDKPTMPSVGDEDMYSEYVEQDEKKRQREAERKETEALEHAKRLKEDEEFKALDAERARLRAEEEEKRAREKLEQEEAVRRARNEERERSKKALEDVTVGPNAASGLVNTLEQHNTMRAFMEGNQEL